jgi:methylase of polypeptide subunit release factors
LRNLKKLPKKTYVLDISKDALEVSKVNIEKHNLQDEITQIESDLLRVFFSSPPARGELEGGTLIITANLPYIKNEDFENMDN